MEEENKLESVLIGKYLLRIKTIKILINKFLLIIKFFLKKIIKIKYIINELNKTKPTKPVSARSSS